MNLRERYKYKYNYLNVYKFNLKNNRFMNIKEVVYKVWSKKLYWKKKMFLIPLNVKFDGRIK